MAKLTGNVEFFTFEIADQAQKLKVVELSGQEAVSRLYNFQLQLACEDPELDFSAILGRPGLITLFSAGDNVERYVSGIVSRFQHIGQKGRFSLYTADLVPQVWLLGHRYDCRIFQNLSVPDIIKQVLDNAGIANDEYKIVIQGSYNSLEYCVQYRESDFNFISRLMEQEGIFYYFEHTKDGQILIIGDHESTHESITAPAQVLYHPRDATVPAEDSVSSFHYAEEVESGSVTLRDFNFHKPSLNLQAAQQYDINKELEVYDFPGKYDSPELGDQRAKIRLGILQVPRKKGTGDSDCMRLVPGYKFKLSKPARADLELEYLITKLLTTGTQKQVLEETAEGGGEYNNQFECIPSDVLFRPEPTSRKPSADGVQTAIVVGPAGEEIYTDEFGRVKVQFHWDRQGKQDE
jgi:type VI secretion system secreted protein VgrG